MNPCPRDRQIQLYHDGELPKVEQLALEEHLATCSICKAELTQLQRFSLRFSQLPSEPMPRELEQRVVALWSRHQEQEISRLVAWFSAAAAVLFLGSLLLGPWSDDSTSSTNNSLVNASAAPASWEVAAINPTEVIDRETEAVRFASWMNAGLSSTSVNLNSSDSPTQTR